MSLPKRYQPGRTLGASDVVELQELLANRDEHILRLDRNIAKLTHELEAARRASRRHTRAPGAGSHMPVLRYFIRIYESTFGLGSKLLGTPFVLLGIVLAAALAVQLALILNPGYFSHDELQWLAFADQSSLHKIPWSAWFDFAPFQYRPLTFNLWLLLSYGFGYHPIAMHLLRILIGIVIAVLLRAVIIRFDVPAQRANIAACMFLLLPSVVYSNAWIGTYADALCLLFVLCAIVWMTRKGQATRSAAQLFVHALPVAALTALALMSKESAVMFPALLAIAAFRQRDRGLIAALAAATLIVVLYLYLRLDTILFAPRESGAYVWSLSNIPQRLEDYAVFPFLTHRFEVAGSHSPHHLIIALCGLGIILTAVASAGWRLLGLFLLGWIVALGPVLILASGSNNYAYLADAFVCGFLAIVWHRLRPVARVAIGLIALLVCVHGYQELREIRHIGRIQYHLYQELPQIVQHSAVPVLIKPERVQEDFVLQRLLHDIPSYRRIPFGGRVIAIAYADSTTTPTYLMAGDGRLKRRTPAQSMTTATAQPSLNR